MDVLLDSPGLTIGVALAAGMVAHVVARHLRMPSIVLLLLTGVLLGPEMAGLVRPESLDEALLYLVGMAVAVILFEGGLNLSVHQLQGQARPLRRLVTVGVVVAAGGGALASHLLMGWSWQLSVPFGALLVVTGPTVVQPVLRRISVRRDLATILEGEAVFVDGIGAVLAVVALEIELATGAAEAATDLLTLPGRFAVGIAIGVLGGLLIGLLLRSERLVSEELKNALSLAFVVALFEISETLFGESGIVAAAVSGLVVGNMRTGVDEELKAFKEQLTVVLLGLLFVLLAATVQLDDIVGLGWRGAATVAAMMLVVRPLSVGASLLGTEVSMRERAFVAWLAPRGVVAAAVASLFAQRLARQEVPGSLEFQALVFLVIAVTVVVQGGLAGQVASLLGVRERDRRGYAIAGANPIGRALARMLQQVNEDVVLLDSSAPECRLAEEEGLAVVQGDARSEESLSAAGVLLRAGMVALTPNPTVNLEVVQAARGDFGIERSAVALSRLYGGLEEAQVHEAGAGILFGRPIDLEFWSHAFRTGAVDVSLWRFAGEPEDRAPGPGGGEWRERSDRGFLPMVLKRNGTSEPVTDRLEFRAGDEVYFAWPYAAGSEAGRWLSERGWRPASESDEVSSVDASADGPAGGGRHPS